MNIYIKLSKREIVSYVATRSVGLFNKSNRFPSIASEGEIPEMQSPDILESSKNRFNTIQTV